MRQTLFSFQSNIAGYKIDLYDCDNLVEKRVFSRQGCLCLCARSPCIRVVATPLVQGYSTKLYFWVDVTCSPIVNLYLNFPSTPVSPIAVNTFTLTDASYGLPISGSLLFTQT